MNAYLFKPRRRVRGKVRESRFWHARYQRDGTTRYSTLNLKVRDKQVAQQRLNDFVQEYEREAAGIVVPKLLRDAAAKALTAHVSDFVADLRARNRSRM